MWISLNGLACDEDVLALKLTESISNKKEVLRLSVQNVNVSGRLLPLILRLLQDTGHEVHILGSKSSGNLSALVEAILVQTRVRGLFVYDLAGRQLTRILSSFGRALPQAKHICRISIVTGRQYDHRMDAAAMRLLADGLAQNTSLQSFDVSDFDVSNQEIFGKFMEGLLLQKSKNELRLNTHNPRIKESGSPLDPSSLSELKISNGYRVREPISLGPLISPHCPPLTHLRRLTLHRFELSQDDWRRLATNCPSLEYLDVRECDTKSVLPLPTLKTLHVSWTLLRQPRVGKRILEALVGRTSSTTAEDEVDEEEDDPFAEEFEQTWRGAKDAAAEAVAFAMDPFQDESSDNFVQPNTTLCDLGAMLDGEDSQKNSAVRWVIKFYLQLNRRQARRNIEAADRTWVDAMASVTESSPDSSNLSPSVRLGLAYYMLRRNPSVWSSSTTVAGKNFVLIDDGCSDSSASCS